MYSWFHETCSFSVHSLINTLSIPLYTGSWGNTFHEPHGKYINISFFFFMKYQPFFPPDKKYLHFLEDRALTPPPPLADMSAKNVFFWTAPLRA